MRLSGLSCSFGRKGSEVQILSHRPFSSPTVNVLYISIGNLVSRELTSNKKSGKSMRASSLAGPNAQALDVP